MSIYSPTNGKSYTAPATVALYTVVIDSALVETVQYFANGTNIGARTNTENVILTNATASNPFQMNWTNVAAGTYTLTAVAT